LTRLTRDHTLAQAALDAGLPVACKSWHHTLTNCLGGRGQPICVEFHHLRLADGDRLLLCSDGLTDMVPDAAVAGVLGGVPHPQAAAQALLELALQNGGKDNVTIVLAHYTV